MQVRPIVMLKLADLVEHPDNPKKPFSSRGKRGLKASMEKYGFAGVCIVAPNGDDTYEVLDANSRRADLEAAGVDEVPCIVMDELQTRHERNLFTLTYDKNAKIYDDDAVVRQLRGLAEAGFDTKLLKTLTGVDNIDMLVQQAAAASGDSKTAADAAEGKLSNNSSLMLYGPTEDIQAIQRMAKSMKGRAQLVAKINQAMVQAESSFDWSDGMIVTLFLATLSRFHNSFAENTDEAEGTTDD